MVRHLELSRFAHRPTIRISTMTAGPPVEPSDASKEDGGWLTAGVSSVGAASFFSDSGHEIATAVLPSFLSSVLHASASALGLIEGFSDALLGLMSMLGGPLANDRGRRQFLATGGYLGTAVAAGAIGLATTVWQAGVLRALGWMSRGLRSPARDSLLASLAPEQAFGRAYGLERAGDNLGAVAGPLLAAGLVSWFGIRTALYFSAIPGVFAAVAITVAAREARRHDLPVRRRFSLELGHLREAGLLGPLLPVALFELANIATTLLILRASQLLHTGGRSAAAAASLAILLYAAHNAVGAVVAGAGGHWIDRSGPQVVFVSGAILYVLAYLGFAVSWHEWPLLLVAFCLAGAGIGLAETAESTLVARRLPDHLRGSGFGLLGGVQALGGFLSSAIVGVLYAAVSPTAGFLYAGGWMALSAVASSSRRMMG